MLPDAMGNAGCGMMARLVGFSEAAVCKGIRQDAAALPEPVAPAELEIVQQGEMWPFADGKKQMPALASLRSAQRANP